MAQPKLISHSVQLQSVDFRDFIIAPVLALIDADIRTSKRFIQFIEEYGFEKLVSGEYKDHLGRLKTVTFRYKRPIRQQRGDESEINEEWIVVHIPILSLIPLPLLQITDAELEYGFHIISVVEEPIEIEGQEQSGDVPSVEPPEEVSRLRCMVAPLNQANLRSEYLHETLDLNLQVKVRVARADIPAGVATLLNLMEDATYSSRQIAIVLPELIYVKKGQTEPITIVVTEKRIETLEVVSENTGIFTVKPKTVQVEGYTAQIKVTGVAEGLASLVVSGGGLRAETTVVVGPAESSG